MMQSFSADPNALLTREQVAAALTDAGFPVRSKSLATMATRGGGPTFRKFGSRPLYRWSDALDWAEARLSPPIRNSSEAGRIGGTFRQQTPSLLATKIK